MLRRTAVIAAGAALLALPSTALGEASDKASCMGQRASVATAPPGSKGAFMSGVAHALGGVSEIVVPAAQCEDRSAG